MSPKKPRTNRYGNPPEMQAALDADVEYLARTGDYGTAYSTYCAKIIAESYARDDEERAARAAESLADARSADAARHRAARARRRVTIEGASK